MYDYDGKRVAVVLAIQGENRVVRGRAEWLWDATLGRVLRIFIDGPENSGMPEILLAPDALEGAVELDSEYGCDICIRLE